MKQNAIALEGKKKRRGELEDLRLTNEKAFFRYKMMKTIFY